MHSFLSSLALAAIFLFAHSLAQTVDFNCPGIQDNAIIRLHPCYNNQLTLAMCTPDRCGQNSQSVVTLQQLSADQLALGNWRVRSTGSDLQPGFIRLVSEAPGGTGLFLSVQAKDMPFANNMFGREAQLASYVDKQEYSMWAWDLRQDRRQCRVLLRNKDANKKLGLIRAGGPMTNNFMRPIIAYNLGSFLTDETWEVEVVQQPTSNGYDTGAIPAQSYVQPTAQAFQMTQPPAAVAQGAYGIPAASGQPAAQPIQPQIPAGQQPPNAQVSGGDDDGFVLVM